MDLIQTFNGQRSLLVRVQKSEPEDAILIASKVNEFLETYDPGTGVQIQVWDDQTQILEDRLNLLIRNGILGFALVFLFLVVMLDLRLATWVAMGVPISFMGAILFFDFLVNINMVSLFALIVVLTSWLTMQWSLVRTLLLSSLICKARAMLPRLRALER